MRILLACEYSGIVREAFKAKGHDAWSCDILPTEIPGQHYQRDVFKVLNFGWDMMIAFPPCTYLTYAGMANWYDKGRAMKRIEAAEFFMRLYESDIPKCCVENPRGIMGKIFRQPDQVIHPYYFGEEFLKRTCLWLKNLPVLKYQINSDLFSERTATERPEPIKIQFCKKKNRMKKRHFCDAIIKQSGKERSKTFQSIANAMAEQWGELK